MISYLQLLQMRFWECLNVFLLAQNRKLYMIVLLILNIWVIKVIESDSKKLKFSEFLKVQKVVHHWNDHFPFKVFVFDLENSSCSYIWLGRVQIMLLMMLVMLLILMIWKIYWYNVFGKNISFLEVTLFQNVEMITSVISLLEVGFS